MGILFIVFLLFVVVGIVGYVIGIYNRLIALNANIDKAWANIDVLLKQRHDELPKLIDTCKAFMTHEKELLEGLTKMRTQFMNATTIEDKTKAENILEQALKSLFAVAENYPDLKSNQNFLQLQSRISALEDQIADRREFVNESVNIYNIRIQEFPNVIIANKLGYQKKPLLEVPKEDTQDVKIDFS